uniref:MFS domain-containing protein n=1 Tax=Macrostomum lignano TaxID=282301 RepID=A0A1I8FPN8_9PLAT
LSILTYRLITRSLGTCLTGLTVAVSIGLVILTSRSNIRFRTRPRVRIDFGERHIGESGLTWTDESKGLITGILVSSFAAGAIVFLPIQSKIINPENLTPDLRIGNDRLFSQHEVTSRTPHSFFIMSAIYASVQLLCHSVLSVESQNARSQSGSSQQAASRGKSKRRLIRNGLLHSAVQSLPFFVMGLSIFFLTPASIAYGETFISNDMLLSVMAGIGGAFNAIRRLVAGIVIDRLHFRVCVLIQGLLFSSPARIDPTVSADAPCASTFILVCSVNFVFAECSCSSPTRLRSCYGSALFAQVYGLVFLFKAVAGALIAAVTTAGLAARSGWTGILVLTAVTSGIGGWIDDWQ